MKKNIFIPLMCLMLTFSSCEKYKGHFSITIQNQSDKEVDICSRGSYPFKGLCALNPLVVVEKNSVLRWRPFNFSIERELGGNSVLELYFVNNRQPQGFYDCDSIPVKNDILRHYRLTLEDLKQSNFTVTYP